MENLPGLVIVLGSPNDVDGNLSEMGRGRVETGYAEYLARKVLGWKILLTGGYGEHFNTTDKPNAFYAKQILLGKGVPNGDIVEFAESKDTVDDALQARPIVKKYNVTELVVVSSDFHMDRVAFIFREIFPDLDLLFSASEYLPARPLVPFQRSFFTFRLPYLKWRFRAKSQFQLGFLREILPI